MKKPSQVVALLKSIEEPRHIYHMEEARWLSRFAKEQPAFITIKQNNDPHPRSPYFQATLTAMGRMYLSAYKWEHKSELRPERIR